jgi:U2-associated protein SR140
LEEIEKKVLMHRKRLQVEYGLSDSSEDGQGSSKLFQPVFLS